jgi:acetyltransferase-like isoleucine patch superfamily enzyme
VARSSILNQQGVGYRAVPESRSAIQTIAVETRTELRRIRNHFFRTTLAGSPLVPNLLRWALYRATGLRILSPNIREQCIMHNSFLEISRGTFVSRACSFEGSGRIAIGEQCQIGPDCAFLTSHHDTAIIDDRLTIARSMPRDIVIGPRVWVGARVMFLPGSVVDGDAVVAAGAVVSGHLERGWIYGGVPATKLRPVAESPRGLVSQRNG